MNKGKRGWSQSNLSKPAADIDIRYGHNLLKQESETWPSYAVVSTPSAFKMAQSHFGKQPAGVGFASYLDHGHLQEVTDGLPEEVDLIVGVGGGTALDASKYAALKRDLPLILVPTILSTGAIIHGVLAIWDGRVIVGGGNSWPWIDCEHVLIDYEVVLRAPVHLNTAGLGDILCNYAKIAEWQRNHRLGLEPPYDEEVVSRVEEFHQNFTDHFHASLDTEGKLTPESVRVIGKALQERDGRERALATTVQSGDHDFAFALELLCDRGWIHGELVAMGAAIIAWYCDTDPQRLLSRLDKCLVRYRPSQMEISRDTLRRVLEYLPVYMTDPVRGKGTSSILRDEPIVGAKFDELWGFLEEN